MVHHHRAQQQQQQQKLLDSAMEQHHYQHHLPICYVDCCGVSAGKKTASNALLLRFIGLFSLISCALVVAPRFIFYPLFDADDNLQTQQALPPPCSSIANNTICCDRTAFRTDVCFMRGDVRTHATSNSLLLPLPLNSSSQAMANEELIRPYTRKWEAGTMATIDELRLKTVAADAGDACDVKHDVPAVVFSTGGYTGNVYHEFNDGILPLYITAQHFNKQVVFVVLEYHDWWVTKYGTVLSQLSAYAPIDFRNDKRTHCFPAAIVGLQIHDELAIDPSKMANNKTIGDFRQLLDEAYMPRIRSIQQEEEKAATPARSQKPKLVVVSRNGSRSIENEADLVKMAEEVGFAVEVLRPQRTTELAKIYRALNSCDAMVGVHGAAMTHFLFMRPGAVFIQIVPLGTDWAAATYYGEPAAKMGLKYKGYGILPAESSLSREYRDEDPVLRDPASVNAKGWEVTKKVYLDGQSVRVDLRRFRRWLATAHRSLAARKKKANRKEKQQEG